MPISISPPTTDIEIISQACAICGKGTFNTIESGGQFARDAAAFYPTLVSAELGSNRWRFALHYEDMGTLSTLTPTFDGWNYYWDMPSDLIMLHRLDPNYTNYTVFGRRVLTNTNQNLRAVYSRNVPVTLWPAPFSMFMIYALASQLATSVTNSDRMLIRIQKDKMMWQDRALFADAQSAPNRGVVSRPWVDVRGSYRTRGR